MSPTIAQIHTALRTNADERRSSIALIAAIPQIADPLMATSISNSSNPSQGTFASVFSRDYLLPYIKTQRSDLLSVHADIEASKYSALAEFVAWYYQELVQRTADSLVASGRIEAPETSYKYALREAR